MIFNYSFSPISEFIRSKGVIDLEDADIEQLKQHLEFEYTPTMQDIRMRCSRIADHAIKNNHLKVYIKNYSTFQSFLMQEFQLLGIRVYGPIYEKMDQDESLVSYNGFNRISYLMEVGIYEMNFRSINSVEYIDHFDQIFSFRSTRATITITFDESFIEAVRTNNIHHLISSKYNLLISNMGDFLSDLRNYFSSELFNTCTDLDSQEVSNFLNYCNYKQANFRIYDPQTAGDFELTLDYYKLVPDNLKISVDILLTSKYNKLNISRNFNSVFNLPSLYRRLGFYYSLVSEFYISNEYLNRYLNIIDKDRYDEDVVFHPKRNLINNLIFSKQLKKAEALALELLDNCDEIQYQFIYHDLASIYRQTGRTDLAIEIYNKLIKMDSLDFWHLHHTQLAITYYKMGERERALELIENSFKNKSKIAAHTASLHILLYFDHHNKLPSLEALREAKLVDSNIGQQLEFFETLENFISDNKHYVDEFSEFLDMETVLPYNYICFIILFKYYFELKNVNKIVEMMDRIESQLRKDELRDNIKLARIYLRNENNEEIYRLLDSIIDLLV